MPFSDTSPLAAVRRATALLGPLALLAVAAPAAGAATRLVAPGAANAGNCTASPCGSLGYAYQQSAAGDVIRVAGGVYPAQVVPGGSKAVTFSGSPGAKLRQLENNAANVTFDGIEVDAAFGQTAGFQNHDAANVTFRDGRIGNVTDEKGALVSGANFTFDNVVFHDVRVTNPSVHNECVYAIGVPGMTVRNSLFYSCATMDLFFTYGSWWIPLPSAYGNVTLENNDFGHTYKDDGTWHYYSLYVGNTAADGGTLSGWKVRNNSFEIDAYVSRTASSGSRWVGNLGAWNCVPGVTYRRNVGDKCADSDKAVVPATSSATRIAPLGWLNPGAQDFRLRAGSPAIDAADPGDYPATDRDGFVRDSRPDAGAHEFGAGPPGGGGRGGGAGEGGTPTGRSPAKKRPRIRAARLKPRVICRRRRASCPAAARLTLVLSAKARVSIRIVRVRHGHKPLGVRSRRLSVTDKRTTRIRAHRLARGRYRVTVVATGRGGLRSAVKSLALRVR